MAVGIIELLADTPVTNGLERLYASFVRRQYAGIGPQAVATWCRRLGYRVHYATYYGQGDPRRLLPDGLDVVFVASHTPTSALAYALAKWYRTTGALTVLGGPHAKAFPHDSLRFFDIVVEDCDSALVDDIVRGRIDPPQIVSSGRPLTDIPSVEERLPEIAAATFVRGRPGVASVVPLLSSVGCPYRCDFCIDWKTDYVALPGERLKADLHYLAAHWPRVVIGYHDPNFAVRFDEVMDIIETVPPRRRNTYLMESSLSILKESRLPRLRATNCGYVMPGIESWASYSDKAGTQGKSGRAKLDQVVAHFRLMERFVPGMQANFLFGTDVDKGEEPAALISEFIRRLPLVWPTINIPTPFGATPLYDKYLREDRILRAMPFAFYYNPYLSVTPRHYGPAEYYDHLIAIHETMASAAMLAKRLLTRSRPIIRFLHSMRTFAARRELAEFRRIRAMLAKDAQFAAFHERRSGILPDFYQREFERRLGPFASLISPAERTPLLHEPVPSAPRAATAGSASAVIC